MHPPRFDAHATPGSRFFAYATWWQALLSLASVLTVAGLSYGLIAAGFPSPESLGILFVLPVLCAAAFFELRLALFTVVLSVAAYNLVLIPPLWTFNLNNPQALAKVVVLLIVTLVVSALASRLKRMTREGQAREDILTDLYLLNQDLVGKTSVKDVCEAAEQRLGVITRMPCRIFLESEMSDIRSKTEFTPHFQERPGQWSAGVDPRLILQLGEADSRLGTLVFTPQEGERIVAESFPFRFLPTLAGQVALAISRAMITEAHAAQTRQADRERFMSAMLSSLSHDFKTPLVGIIGALETLQSRVDADARDLVSDGLTEAQRLNRFVVNLVEVSRLEAGVRPKCEPVHIRDAVSGVLRTLRPLIGMQTFRIIIEPGFPLLNVNPSLFDLVLLNLIENAIKYGPLEGDITIEARVTPDGVLIDIDDDGDGIPTPLREQVFTKFYRAAEGDRKIAGTGLGLYICREIMNVYAGTVAAIDPPDGTGACMRLSLPSDITLPVLVPQEEAE
ncbi:ATP-binding protein [Asticcacaulis sp. AC402]|uniref:sensor histidine kinase n=1 Tax=Asticcacaulis sp. AC402 TaxID=1282361 RepID=UPI0003C3C0B2|nr:ATP-binding protein [Asticcacaulis sp. AC402]ESQ76081.1 hypothetical protein ABAC402_06440 [Asticcacaulis sp. AC402]